MDSMIFYAQEYCRDDNGNVISLTNPQKVAASTHDQAAEVACGKGLTPDVGHRKSLAAKIWRIGANSKPDIKLYYRPPN